MSNSLESIVSEIFIIAFLTIINAFFSASEMAIVSLNKNKINHLAEDGDEKALLILKLLEEPGKLLAAIQVGITFAGFLASASAATTLSKDFAQLLERFNLPYSERMAVIIITIVLAYITLVFGELFPKRVALQQSEAISMIVVKPIIFILKITSPFVKLLSSSTNGIMKLFGMDLENIEEKVSREELKSLIEIGEESGVINEIEREMINGIFEFDDKLAKEVMTPRTNVFAIDINNFNNSILEEVFEEKYSRVPVYDDDIDNVIGILYIKDLISEIRKTGEEDLNIKDILRTPYFVPETKIIDVLFRELQNTKNHMAILIDEYGGFSGIVTIEDLVEEIMGNIFDEHDEEEQDVKKIDAETYMVNGLLAIDEVNDILDLDLDSETSDTIGGFVIDLLGSIPKDEDENTIEYENVVFRIEKVNEKRIEKLKIYVNR